MVTRSGLIIAILSSVVLVTSGCNKGQPGTTVELQSVTGIVSSASDLSTLWTVVTEAEMRADLDPRRGSVTLLAPTNEAFAALGQETLNRLLNKENKAELQQIVRNHVIEGAVTAPQLAQGELGANQLGKQLPIGRDDTGATTVDGARVIRSIRANNGYVHVIGAVLLPSPPSAPSAPSGS